MATTTWSRMAKKAASSSGILLANRTPRRNYTSGIITTPLKSSTTISSTRNSTFNQFGSTLVPTRHHFSALSTTKSNSDDSLLKVIKSEVDFVEEGWETPRDFPFKIKDRAWKKDTITLTREYQDENIKVTVKGPCWIQDEESYSNYLHRVILEVSISKKWRPTLKFTDVLVAPDGISMITRLHIKNPYTLYLTSKKSPKLSNLNNLHEGFKKYLEVRGLEPKNIKFLWLYMVNKEEKQNTPWLKSMKSFIGNEAEEFSMLDFCRDITFFPLRMVWSIRCYFSDYY